MTLAAFANRDKTSEHIGGSVKSFVFALAAVTFLSVTAHALEPDDLEIVESLVVRDIDSMLSETFNESDGTAEVTAARCSAVSSNPVNHIAFCSVDINVQPNADREYENTITCTSMKYEVSSDLTSVNLVGGWEKCIEAVNSVEE